MATAGRKETDHMWVQDVTQNAQALEAMTSANQRLHRRAGKRERGWTRCSAWLAGTAG